MKKFKGTLINSYSILFILLKLLLNYEFVPKEETAQWLKLIPFLQKQQLYILDVDMQYECNMT